jgi:hypothetical protein
MDVQGAYIKLKRVGFVANHTAFSLDYLNKHPGYFDDLIYTGRQPSTSALVSLYVRINAIIDRLDGDISVSACREVLKFLAADVWTAIVQKCCSLLPPNRLRPAQTKQVNASSGPYKLSPSLRKSIVIKEEQADSAATDPELQGRK